MPIKAIKLPSSAKGSVTAEDVRGALERIAETEKEREGSYHFTFSCPEGLFEKAQRNAKARRVSLSYWVSELLSAKDEDNM